MPRNGSGTFSTVNTFSAGQTIESGAMNANFSDIGTEITNSVARDGQSTMTGPLKASDGTAAAPSITFGSDTDSGLYKKSANTIGVSVGGSEVVSISSSGIADTNGLVVTAIPTGTMMMFGATTAPTGYVRCNGRTIGNAASGATERANADTSSLYEFLWTNYIDAVLAVSTGRGASAAADYAANKTIALPDLRGRSPFGLDDMGSSTAGRITASTPFAVGNPTINGSGMGDEGATLSIAQLPIVTPAGSVAAPTITVSNGTNVVHASSFTNTQNGSGTTAIAITNGAESLSTITASSSAPAFTGTPFGSGAEHTNVPPGFLTTFIIKL